jgi:hypothetical protein
MAGPFTAYFESEHRRLGRLLKRALPATGDVATDRFDEFRRALLQRIAVEERVLFPALEKKLGRQPLYRRALARDHGGLVAICAPTPHREWVDGLWEQLEYHHAIELGDEGFCAQCDDALGRSATTVLRRAAGLPTIEVPAYGDGLILRQRIAELLVATGVSH